MLSDCRPQGSGAHNSMPSLFLRSKADRVAVNGGTLSASVVNQGYVAIQSPSQNSVLFPSVGVNASGRAVIAFSIAGQDFYPSAGYVTLDATTGTGPIVISRSGFAPDDGLADTPPSASALHVGATTPQPFPTRRVISGWATKQYCPRWSSFLQGCCSPTGEHLSPKSHSSDGSGCLLPGSKSKEPAPNAEVTGGLTPSY